MNTEVMRATLRVTKALADPQRLRILMMLEPGELCVCQIVEVLGLAPSTVSKHLSILAAADIVMSRKDGRWAYYHLPNSAAGVFSQPVLHWLSEALHDDGQILSDREKLTAVTACDPEALCRRQRKGDGVLGEPAGTPGRLPDEKKRDTEARAKPRKPFGAT